MVEWAVPLILALLLAAALAVAVRLARARRRAEAEATELRDTARRLEALLASAPQAYAAWAADGTSAAAPRLPQALGLDRVDRIEEVETALQPGDAAALHGCFARLREAGAPFSVTVEATTGRALELNGRRGLSADGAAAFDVLWIADVSDRETRAAEARQARDSLTDRLAEAEARLARLAEAEMRVRRLDAVLEALPLPIWLRDGDLRMVMVNRAFAEGVDADPAQVLAEQRELGAGHIAGGGRALAARARGAGEACSESHHVVLGGERRLLTITETPATAGGADDAPPIVGFAVDDTRREEAEAELGRHISAHRNVLENLQSAIAIYGPDKRLQFYNQAYVRLWGFEEGWLETGPTLSEMLEDLRARRRLPEYADFRSFKESQVELFTSLLDADEDLLHLPDGTTLRSLISPHPFGGLMFVLEDVTSALMLERNYNTLMAVQRETLDNLAEGIAVYGGDGRLRLSNPAFAQIWNLRPEDLDGSPHIAEVLDRASGFFDDGGDWEGERDAMIAWALDRQPASGRMERADGSILEYSTVPLPDGAVLNSFLDVTDSARVEQALRASNQALETADRLKSEFIANVSYQLRTPLNAIMGFAEILDKQYFGPMNERQIEYSASIVDASKRLLALINDILDIATIEAGYMALELKTVDVEELLRGVLDLTREWGAKQSLTIAIDCPPGLGSIEADERRLKQALYNLVSNAVKFTPPGGQITLSAWRRQGSIGLVVADNGIGIPKPDQDRVFGRFERGHPHLRHSGVGLGLSLVRSFIEMHGGTVKLDSEPGVGTTVTCVLPAHPIAAYTGSVEDSADGAAEPPDVRREAGE
jgi:signal transduction histidine kinase